jgi:WhiB family transcriptional regulator, redox-sensing transcriptional regulator
MCARARIRLTLTPDDTSNRSRAARLLTVVLPGAVTPALGEWHGRGLCVGEDLDVFFPSHGDPGVQARAICASCRVRADCLRYATEADEFGIWGGLDQSERRYLARRQRRKDAAARAKAEHCRRMSAADWCAPRPAPCPPG